MFRLLLLLTCLPAVFCALGGLVGRIQSSGVRGTLLCNGKPASRVLVKLYDDDRGLYKYYFIQLKNLKKSVNFELKRFKNDKKKCSSR